VGEGPFREPPTVMQPMIHYLVRTSLQPVAILRWNKEKE